MQDKVKIPISFILEMDDVGWDDGRDLRLRGQASRSGLPRRHALEDYEFLKALTESTGKHIAAAICVGDWDKDNFLRGAVGFTHDPYGWDRASTIDIEHQRRCLDTLENANVDYMVHGNLHGRYDEQGKLITESEYFEHVVGEDGRKIQKLPSEKDMEERLDMFFKIYNSWGMKQKIRGFVTPCGASRVDEKTVIRMTKVLHKYGIRYWADIFKYPEFEGKSLKVYNGVACIRWGVNKTEMPWEAYDIDPDTLQIFNTDESKRSCLHGSHWTNYLRFNPKRNLEGVKGWTDFYNRQAEMFGGVNAKTLAEAVNQLFYYEFAKLEVCDKEAVIDLSEMNEQKLDCHINEFFISFKKGTEPIACEGGDISLYEEHKEFNTYKIVHDADTVKIALK